jgi:hypothetical protein
MLSTKHCGPEHVRAAQNKIVIARFLGDALMWTKAVEEYRQATGAQP